MKQELGRRGGQRVRTVAGGRPGMAVREASWISLYRINVRMVDRYRIGRVFLAGDAAGSWRRSASSSGRGANG
ncbi:hypothetical protein GCM10029978_058600 [Actinoallomurus acanthiterrae]